jgi:hypothetical protein
VLDGKETAGKDFVRRWLKKSRFSTIEVSDVFQALEEMSDFTIRSRPDVIVMEVASLSEDFRIIKNIVQISSSDIHECPIFAFSSSGEIAGDKENFQVNLHQLEAKLDEIIPKLSYVRAA